MSAERWEAWLSEHKAGRDDYPALLMRLYRADPAFRRDADQLAYALDDAWNMPDHPALGPGSLSPADWVLLFGEVGYVVDGRRAEAERPAEPIRLYRGAHPTQRRGMSWTDSLDVAAWFTGYHSPWPEEERVYVAEVPPAALLAKTGRRGESEYVVNMRGVRTRALALAPDEVKAGSKRHAAAVTAANAAQD